MEKLMMYEKFVMKNRRYKSDTYIEYIKNDLDERGEIIVSNLLEKELHLEFGDDLKVERYETSVSYMEMNDTHYPGLVMFNYKGFKVWINFNSTRMKTQISIKDIILDKFIYTFGKSSKKISDSMSVLNTIKKLKAAFKYLESDDYNTPERKSLISINKFKL